MTLKRLKKAKTEIKKLKAAIFDFLKYCGFIFLLKYKRSDIFSTRETALGSVYSFLIIAIGIIFAAIITIT